MRVHAGPPNWLIQSLGGRSPPTPLPSRKWKRSRSGEPGAAASACWNQTCSSEVWLGTMSSRTRSPSACASASSSVASSRVPKIGSIARKSETS